MSDFGNRLHRIRREKRITQRQLEKETGLAAGYVAKLEDRSGTRSTGNPRLETIQKIATALDVAVSELTGEVGGDVERAIMWSELDDEDRRSLIRVYRAMLAHPK